MANGAGAGSAAIKPGRSGARADSSSDSPAAGRGSTFSRSWPRSLLQKIGHGRAKLKPVRVVFGHLDFQPLGSSLQFLDFANPAVEGNRCVPANGEPLAPAILAPLKIVGASWVFFLMAVHYDPVSFDPPAAVHNNGAVTVPDLSYDSFGDIHFHGHLLAKAVPP